MPTKMERPIDELYVNDPERADAVASDARRMCRGAASWAAAGWRP